MSGSLPNQATGKRNHELLNKRINNRRRTIDTLIPKRDSADPAPLSFAQQRLWFLDQLQPGDPTYNIHRAYRLSGRLNEQLLEKSLTEIVRRHDALRTTLDEHHLPPLSGLLAGFLTAEI